MLDLTKTIVFSWIYPLSDTVGGIERVTRRLMDGLSQRGYNCLFLMHDTQNNRFFSDGKDVGSLDDFLIRRDVNTLVNQNGYSSEMTESLYDIKWHGKYIVCHHNEPLYLRKIYDLRRVVSEVLVMKNTSKARLAWLGRFLSYPLWQKISTRRIAETQDLNYQRADKYVVLSPGFLPEVSQLIGRPSIPKAVAIPNPLSFEIAPNEIGNIAKKNVALIVARLNDGEKRISSALEAWQVIENQDRDNWTLKIVGDGPDALALQKKAQKLGLKRVEFLGSQDPLPHYQSASIFFMTSRVEGWGLTLTEAMQTGTVPIAFDAYTSLRDIIDDGETGVIVHNGDIAAFVKATQQIMENPVRRNSLATNALSSCQRYRLEAVLDKWETIL